MIILRKGSTRMPSAKRPARPHETYCGPAAVAAATGVTRVQAMNALCHVAERRRRIFWPLHIRDALAHFGIPSYVVEYPKKKRRTLKQWLLVDGRDAVVFVSTHFVFVKDGQVSEDNGWPATRGEVRAAIILGTRSNDDE